MITAERLEELIKQGETIYENIYERVRKVDLSTDHWLYKFKENTLIVMCKQPCVEVTELVIRNLFETKEQAEWALKTVAERTERFEPPMWEDIKGYYRFNFMNCENGVWKKYSFELLKKQDDKAKEGGCISIWTGTKDIYNKTTPTKENYEKACKIVRDLFKGEK